MTFCYLTIFSVLFFSASWLRQSRTGVYEQTGVSILQNTVETNKVVGFLEYWGRCDGSPDFPQVHIPQNSGASPVETLRGMFSEDQMMRVVQERGGEIRM